MSETITWLDENQSAEKEEFEAKQKELEELANPIMQKVYSAAGGAAVSVLLQVVAPSALKLFLPRAVVPPVVVPDYRRVEMAIVDGIFGSQIAFLLYRAIAVFIAPL